MARESFSSPGLEDLWMESDGRKQAQTRQTDGTTFLLLYKILNSQFPMS